MNSAALRRQGVGVEQCVMMLIGKDGGKGLCGFSAVAWVRGIAALALLCALPGCGSLLTVGTGDAAGIAGAGIAGSVTKDATVGAAIGLGVASAANAGLQYAERRLHRAEQDQIATTAGTLPDGGVGVWQVAHDVAIEPDEHGQVAVTRRITAHPPGGVAFDCKEIVFSVTETKTHPTADDPTGYYTATVCADGPRWKWASAEPATERWGSLQ